jgi:hypothetical protein
MGTAGFGLVLGCILVGFFLALPVDDLRQQLADALGFSRLLDRTRFFIADADMDSVLYLVVLPCFIMSSLFAFSAVSATNRMKTRSGNHSTNLKVFFISFMVLGAALWLVLLFRSNFSTTWERWLAVTTVFGALGIVATLSSFCAAEDPLPALPARLRSRATFLPFRPFRPGSIHGFYFTIMANTILIFPAIYVLSNYLEGRMFLPPMFGLTALILSFLYLSASIGMVLSTFVSLERARMAFQSGLVTLVVFLPLILFAILHRFERIPFLSPLDPGLLSPVVAFGSLTTGFYEQTGMSIEGIRVEYRGSIFPYEIALGSFRFQAIFPTVVAYILLGSVLMYWARRRLKERKGWVGAILKPPDPSGPAPALTDSTPADAAPPEPVEEMGTGEGEMGNGE